MMNEIRRVAFFPDFIKTSLKFSIFGVINTIFHIFNDFLRLMKNILFLKELIFKCQWGHEN